jgi:hypothetical protein
MLLMFFSFGRILFYGFWTKEVCCTLGYVVFHGEKRMLAKIVRRLTLEEVHQRIENFEKKYGMTFDEFEELYLKKRVDRQLLDSYYEWTSLVHAYRGYVESGELDYFVEELLDLTPSKMALLTPKRLELLYSLASLRIESINDLAQKTRRNIKNVYEDLHVLKSLGFITLRREEKETLFQKRLWKKSHSLSDSWAKYLE